MALSKQQAEEIKKQLLVQIDQQPIENKEQIKQQIQEFNEEKLEQFLKENNIQFGGGDSAGQTSQSSTSQPSEQQCILCSIAQNKVPSHKIAETKKAIAILELNPLSKGHSIVLPLEHVPVEKLPKSALSLAQKIAKKIKMKLKPKEVKIETSSFMNHAMINIIPIYKDEKLEKKQANEKELEKLQSKLETKTRTKRASKEKQPKPEKKIPQISFRIP